MKIAFVINAITSGGAERQTVNLAKSLADIDGNHLFLFSERKRAGEYPLTNLVTRLEILKNNLLLDAWQVIKYAKKYDIDVLIGMGIYANWILCLARFCCHSKVIVSEMNDPRHDRLSKKSRLLRKLLYWRGDGFVFQTEEEKNFYSAGIQSKSIVIPNPICGELPLRNSLPKKRIVAVGRLMPQKNYPLLLKSFSKLHLKHPDYELHIYGQGEELNSLTKLSEDLKIQDKVFFEGFCLNVHQAIQDSDIYVMSSDFEGMPNALMEAMGMGFPVVSTDCGGGGPKALIQSGKNGLLTRIGDETQLADTISFLIEHPKEKEKMGKEASKINQTHSLEEIGKKWMDFSLSLICKK